jgi:hypothetical protein
MKLFKFVVSVIWLVSIVLAFIFSWVGYLFELLAIACAACSGRCYTYMELGRWSQPEPDEPPTLTIHNPEIPKSA